MKVAEESLPAMQVKAIQNALQELEQLREDNKNGSRELKRYKEDAAEHFNNWRDQSNRADQLQNANETLLDENKKLKEEHTQDLVNVLQGKLEATNQTVDKFLKNTVYRESLQHQAIDESPNMTYVTGANGMSVPTQQGVNKRSFQVTDTNERTAE